MEYRLNIIGDFLSEVLGLSFLIFVVIVAMPLLKLIFNAVDIFYQKDVQNDKSHGIIDMSQGGKYGKRINKQRPTRRRRGF